MADSPLLDEVGTCFSYDMITTNGIWIETNLRGFSLPLLIISAGLVILTTELLALGLKPLRQPRVVAEILAGIVLGPTLLGKYVPHYDSFFPKWSINIYETMAHLGLFLFVFLVGVDMDITALKRTATRALAVAAAGMALPFAATTAVVFLLRNSIYADMIPDVDGNKAALYFLGLTLSVTAFPVVTRILAELKLLGTDFGRIALFAALINDVVAWSLFPTALESMGMGTGLNTDYKKVIHQNHVALRIAGSVALLAVLCCGCVRPTVWLIQRQTPEGESVSNASISAAIGGVMLAGFLSESIGVHYLFGGFAFGLAIPAGPVATALVERLEEFVSTLMLPLFFASSGLRTDFTLIFRPMDPEWHKGPVLEHYHPPQAAISVAVVISGAAKVGGTILATLFHSMPLYEGISLGLLMNCKSLVEIVMLNIAKKKLVLSHAAFPVMVLEDLMMTLLVTPVVMELYRPLKVRPLFGYKRRNLQRSKPDEELRMLACVHNARNVPAFLGLLEVSNPTKRSPILIFALHLVELTGRASAMVIAHGTSADRAAGSKDNGGQGQSEHIIAAFETYEEHAGGVTVDSLTAIAEYSSMHEDICAVAGDKHVAMIVLPFHKQLAVDGGMEEIHPAIRTLNQKVLDNAPCSVGILVDRGISGTARHAGGHHHVAVLFFGGPDDREALAYACRMAEHPGITLTVLRFLPGEEAIVPPSPVQRSSEASESRVIHMMPTDEEQKLDDEYVSEFRFRYVRGESVMYIERVVSNSEETVAAIRSLDSNHDLYVVGRAQGLETPLTAGLTQWSEHPELGPIGDLLASSDFGVTVSVLVVQQYVSGRAGEPESPGRQVRQYLTNANRKAKGAERSGFSTGWLDAA